MSLNENDDSSEEDANSSEGENDSEAEAMENNNERFSFEAQPDGDNSCTIVKVPRKERDNLNWPFLKSLIIKLLGRNIGFKLLKKLHQMWANKGIISVIDWKFD